MSRHQEWKMIHLLYRYARRSKTGDRRVLSEEELQKAGVHCYNDSILLLANMGVVNIQDGEFELSIPASKILSTFVVGKGPMEGPDLRVDYPEVFVIMPFSETWSDRVYKDMFIKGIEDAGYTVERGDTIVRIGELQQNVWNSIKEAGLIIAEVSVPNPNVYYEIGLADALGKPVFLYKQKGVELPADFGGDHYYEYDIDDLDSGRIELTKALKDLAEEEDHKFFGVKELIDDLKSNHQ